jgi:hypothetical protein
MLADAAKLAVRPPGAGKLQMQSAINALAGKPDVNLRDCSLLVRTGVLSDASSAALTTSTTTATPADVRELLARLQIGHGEAKGRAVDGLLDALGRGEKSVISTLGRASVAALVQLLTAPAPAVREKAATVVHQLGESGNCEALRVSEGIVSQSAAAGALKNLSAVSGSGAAGQREGRPGDGRWRDFDGMQNGGGGRRQAAQRGGPGNEAAGRRIADRGP